MASTSKRVRLTESEIEDEIDYNTASSDLSELDYDSDEENEDIDSESSEFSERDDVNASETESNDSECDETDDNGWKRLIDSTQTNLQKNKFTVNDCGPQLRSAPSPQMSIEFFQLFFTDELFQNIVDETNRYAAEKLKYRPLQQHSIWNSWANVSIEEMKAFIGVILNMAINSKPEIDSYFSKNWLDFCPFFSDIFSRKRFRQIFWMLHVSPPSRIRSGPESRASKVKNIVTYLKKEFLENFIPGCEIAVDESTVPFKGRIAFKMYNPQKPVKWGMRVYVLGDCTTGYVCCFEPYYGTFTTQLLTRPDLPFTSRIVLNLCEELLSKANGSGYHLFTDRLYTSCTLAEELLKLKIDLTGTVKSNRIGMPQDVKQKKKLKLKNQEMRVYVKEKEMMVIAWKDKRQVLVLSTCHDGSSVITPKKN